MIHSLKILTFVGFVQTIRMHIRVEQPENASKHANSEAKRSKITIFTVKLKTIPLTVHDTIYKMCYIFALQTLVMRMESINRKTLRATSKISVLTTVQAPYILVTPMVKRSVSQHVNSRKYMR